MKKIALVMVLAAASSASAANYIGGSIGSGLSVHYQTDQATGGTMRYSLNLDALGFNFNRLSIGGSADYLASVPGNTYGSLTPYYGLGLGAGVALGSGNTGFAVYPHVLGGLNYTVTDPLSVFGEVNAGPSYTSGYGFSFGFGARLGVNYRLQ